MMKYEQNIKYIINQITCDILRVGSGLSIPCHVCSYKTTHTHTHTHRSFGILRLALDLNMGRLVVGSALLYRLVT